MSLILLQSSLATLAAPTVLYCDDDSAQAGSENPVIHGTAPHFSMHAVPITGIAITQVEIQVSAANDGDFSETLSWNPGAITLSEELAAEGRTKDVIYGQGA